MYYFDAVYNDPKLARFISADTIVPNFADPQSLNRYSYVNNNPINYTDPSGHFSWKKLLAVVEVVVGAVLVAVGEGGPVSYIGLAMMTHGVETLNGNANISTSTQVGAFGGGGGSNGGIEYTGPGSGGGGPGDGYNSGSGGSSGGAQYGTGGNMLYLNLYNYSSGNGYNESGMDSINRDMMPEKTKRSGKSSIVERVPWLQYDNQGHIIWELGIEANPLVDPTAVLGGVVQGVTRGTINATHSSLRNPAMARSTSKGIKRIFDALRVRHEISATDLIPLNPEKLIINQSNQKYNDESPE